ncbi:MAG: lysophospholipid transporter LplT [Rhodocyclaceae bacterium]|nr:lysophospholipid transporter LplT [Rhodocyclaceae bacterium]
MNSRQFVAGDYRLTSLAMMALLLAQFLSALADNTVLVAAIALSKAAGHPGQVPLLQASFVLAFILLAPFLGPLADSHPKGRVMLAANGVKLLGAGMMVAGAPPLLAYAVIGLGAAGYSPAKYGILSQMFTPAHLVKANGLMEGSTIVAILLGVLLGGWLSDRSLTLAFGAVIACYGLAALANLLIPRLAPEHPVKMDLAGQLRRFSATTRTLFAHADVRFSLLGTSLFWGSGSTLRLMLFAWVPAVLGIMDNGTPAQLMGALSVGIVLGAGAAGAWVSLERVNRALIGGLALGPLILALALLHNLGAAYALMAAVGACGGFFVVPLNALLQERGHRTVGAGQALAVQNFAENLAMLLLVGAYSAAEGAGLPVTLSAAGFGALILAAMLALAGSRRR